ncbi:hypothetical protein [Microbacterium sp. NPDC087665]|uniref:hypothetical protein n=1 Tax=Microbacterium sp. NPDC087665 TaxID=3364194 RepID=UPI0037F78F8D
MPIKSKQLGPGSLKFGETASEREFASQLRKAELNPNVEDGDTLPVLSGEELTEDDEITWEVGGSLLQDYDADSLELWCFEHAGQWMPWVFTPNNDGTQSWQGEAKIRPIKIGGDVKTRNTSDFTFPARNVQPIGTGTAGRTAKASAKV